MNSLLKIGSLTLLLSAAVLSGCSNSTETPATEVPTAAVETSAPEVEVAVIVAKQGGAAVAVVVAKSTEDSESVFVASTRVEMITAKVSAINAETREVSLIGENGMQFDFVASADVKNLELVSVGDTVHAKHMQRVTVELVEGQELKAKEAIIELAAQAKEGQMPAKVKAETLVRIYTIEAINIEENSFKLRSVDGAIKEFTAKDPKNLARASVGDAVVVTITEALAIEVVKATAG